MKRTFAILLLLLNILSQTVVGLDRFFFDQCECPNGAFSSADDTGEVGTFTVTGEIECPSTPELGFVKDFTSPTTISGNVGSTFFNDETPTRTSWVAVLDVDLSNVVDGEEIGLISLLGVDVTLLTGSGFVSINMNGNFVQFGSIVGGGITRFAVGEFVNPIVTGVFGCVGAVGAFESCGDFGTQPIANGFVLGDINSDVVVNLFNSGTTGSIKLQAMAFEEVAITSATVGQVDSAVAGIDFTADALPLFNGFSLATEEDVDLENVDLNDFLDGSTSVSFIIDDPLEINGFGTLTGLNTSSGVFDLFDVNANAFGNATFAFDYTYAVAQPFECTLTVDEAAIEILPVEDVPTLVVVDPVDTVAFVDINIAVVVAVSIDFPDEQGQEGPLLVGFVHIASTPTKGSLFLSDCSTPLAVADQVSLNSVGEFEFCYQGNADNVEGNADSFTYTVRSETNEVANEAAGFGVITLIGGNPVVPNPDVETRAAVVDEDSGANEIIIGVDNFAQLGASVSSFDFQVQITTLPAVAVGVLRNDQNEAVTAGDIFNSGDSLFFTPTADFFNANAAGGPNNDENRDIFGVDCGEAEKVNGVCPDTFNYNVQFGNPAFVSDDVSFGLIVRAVDDAGAVFTVEEEEVILLRADDAVAGFVTVTGTALEVSSDNGGNVFNMGIRFVGVNGAQVQLPTAQLGDPTSFNLDSGSPNGDCISAPCNIMHLIGTPNQLNGFLDKVEFRVPDDQQQSRVDLLLASGVDSTNLQENIAAYGNVVSSVDFEVEARPSLVVVDDLQTLAFVDLNFGVVVAVSSDFPDGQGQDGPLLDGFVHISTLPTVGTLFNSDCSTPIAAGDAIALNNETGFFEFCYQGDENMLEGDTDTISYTVRPGSNDINNAAVGTGVITLLGGVPVIPNSDVTTRSAQVAEDSSSNEIVIGADNFGELNSILESFDFQIEILTLPSIGTLQKDGNVDVTENEIFNSGDSLFFTPNAAFFNANAEGGATNDANVDLFGTDCEEAEKVNGVCPDTFTYRVLFGTPAVQSAAETFGLIVTAVDDAGAVFTVEEEDVILVNSDAAVDGFVTVTGSVLEVSSDDDQNVFNIGIRFVGVGGVQLQLPAAEFGDPLSLNLDSGTPNGDCISDPCNIMHLIGTPSQLNGFLDKVEIKVPEDEEENTAPRVDLLLASGVDFADLQQDIAAYGNVVSTIDFLVEAIPTLVAVDDIQTLAFVDSNVAVVVAVSSDFPDAQDQDGPLLEGFVHIATLPTAGTLFNPDCTTTIEADDVIALNNETGFFEFCYQGDENNLAGDSDSFTFTVRPGSNDAIHAAVGTGVITLLGGTPVAPNSDVTARTVQIVEDSSSNEIVIGADNFAELDSTLESFNFQIEILTVPSIGSLQKAGNVAVSPNEIFNSGDSLFFTPNANFFNANAEAGATSDANVDLFGSGCEEAEKVNGVCPDTFTYRVLFGNAAVASASESFGLIVTAVDDADASFTVEQNEAITVLAENAVDDLINVNGLNLEVTSDEGADVFFIGVRFAGVNGVTVQLPAVGSNDPESIRFDEGSATGNCTAAPCSVMHLIGTPSQLNAVFSAIEYFVPDDSENELQVDLFLASGVDEATLRDDVESYGNVTSTVEFVVEEEVIDNGNDGFFDDENNIYYVAAGGGGLLLVLLIVGGVMIGSRGKTRSKEKLFDDEEEESPPVKDQQPAEDDIEAKI